TASSRNLLAAERDAGVGHHVAVSIVGADRLPDSGYLRAKVAQEAEIEAASIPYTILRATQFFEFLSQIVEAGAEGDSVRLSTGLIQFVAADDVAATVAELAIGAPLGGRVGRRVGRSRPPPPGRWALQFRRGPGSADSDRAAGSRSARSRASRRQGRCRGRRPPAARTACLGRRRRGVSTPPR